MRTSPFRDLLAAQGARFRERYGTEVAAGFADRETEYRAVRDAVGVTDFSWMRAFSFPEEQGIDFLDALVAGNVPKIRFGRLLHTFLADEEGLLLADCFVANNDREFIFLCESIVADEQLDTILSAGGFEQAGGRDLRSSHALLSLDGFRSWEIVKKLFGADVLGLPYLSVENYAFEGQTIQLFRAGKTSEFGYLLLAPMAVAPALFETCRAEAGQRSGRLCGVDVHDDLRLDGRFFNIHAEGRRVRDPLALGLQWMIDFEKEQFAGAGAIKARRAAGLRRKIAGVAGEPGGPAIRVGGRIFLGSEPVGEVVADCFSFALGQPVALALFPVELAYSGVSFRLDAPDGPVVRTISMPPIMPRSLTVKLDEL